MTNEKIKEILLSLENTDTDFTVIQTGKVSKKVNGLYTPATFEIFLHNKNFTTENELIYTAIHEYTHHLIKCKQKKLGIEIHNGGKSHTIEFWAKFDDLLEKAVEAKIYTRERSKDLSALIEEAKEIDREIVNLKKKLGKILLEINEKSQKENIRFEDLLSHDLNISKNTAEKCLRSKNIEENFGQDEMETVLKVKDLQAQQRIINGLKNGKTTSQALVSINQDKNYKNSALDKKVSLVNEQLRLERIIQQSKERLEIVLETLSSM